MKQLPMFEGKRPTLEIVKLTGTFEVSEALQQAHKIDDEVVLMVRGRVTKVSHEEKVTKDVELLARAHSIAIEELVIVEEGVDAYVAARSRALENAGVPELELD